MFPRIIRWVASVLCLVLSVQAACAGDNEGDIERLEARLIYESASKLMSEEQYDRALTRFRYIRTEYAKTEYAMLAEQKMAEIAVLRIQPRPISGTSRATLVGFGTLFTTWFGVGTMILAEADDATAYGLALIVGPLSGLAGSLSLTRNAKLGDGQASLINLGGAWGIWQASGAAIVANADEKAVVGASMAGGLVGLALSTSIVNGHTISPGDATMINFGGIWGTWLAICGTMAADVQDDDTILTTAMIGGDAGLLTMAVLTPTWQMSRTRARLINIGGIVGTLYGIGTNVLFEIDAERNAWV